MNRHSFEQIFCSSEELKDEHGLQKLQQAAICNATIHQGEKKKSLALGVNKTIFSRWNKTPWSCHQREQSAISLLPNENAGDLSRLRSDIYKAAKSTATKEFKGGGREVDGGGRMARRKLDVLMIVRLCIIIIMIFISTALYKKQIISKCFQCNKYD